MAKKKCLLDDIFVEKIIVMDKQGLNDALSIAIGRLYYREKTVVCLYYNSFGVKYTMAEIGKLLNIEISRVRSIRSKALRKLRHPSESSILKKYLSFN